MEYGRKYNTINTGEIHRHNIRIPTLDIAMYIFPNSLPIWRTREIENTIIPRPWCVRIK